MQRIQLPYFALWACVLLFMFSLPALAEETTEQRLAKLEQQITNLKREQTTRPASGANAFNPALSVVLQGAVKSYQLDPTEFTLSGMPLGGEAALGAAGLSMTETEVTASANIDDWFFGQATIGFHVEDNQTVVDVEEAFFDSLALPAGLGVRGGRFYSAIGHMNQQHTHAWDFTDAPLAYLAFLGKQYKDDGLRLTWTAPTDLYLEIGGEALRGGSYPAGGLDSQDAGSVRNAFAKVGGDFTATNSWLLGLSQLQTNTLNRSAGGGHSHGGEVSTAPTFDGASKLTSILAIWKWQSSTGQMLTVQAENFNRAEDGVVNFTEDSEQAQLDYQGSQQGYYLQTIMQFSRQWRMGFRGESLSASNNLSLSDGDVDSNGSSFSAEEVISESGFESIGKSLTKNSMMVDYSRSEFSRFRLQYALDQTQETQDQQIQLQYIMTFGAHGAHSY
ncbi:MAG: hypothetical protein QNL04_07825 [SAR324 cluster bacterium]|nr:hypothetical protein [SAR324 cluster bacterium]